MLPPSCYIPHHADTAYKPLACPSHGYGRAAHISDLVCTVPSLYTLEKPKRVVDGRSDPTLETQIASWKTGFPFLADHVTSKFVFSPPQNLESPWWATRGPQTESVPRAVSHENSASSTWQPQINCLDAEGPNHLLEEAPLRNPILFHADLQGCFFGHTVCPSAVRPLA